MRVFLLVAHGHPAAHAAVLAQDAGRPARLFRLHHHRVGRNRRGRAVDERVELREHRVGCGQRRVQRWEQWWWWGRWWERLGCRCGGGWAEGCKDVVEPMALTLRAIAPDANAFVRDPFLASDDISCMIDGERMLESA